MNGVNLMTKDPHMHKILKVAENIAASKATVVITGESGTGKEVLAKYIHQNSHRNKHRFVAINCAAVPENLLESELFGHEKGAFTGAIQTHIGKFELAHRGTLLLDEVGDLPLHLQAKLLRVIQENELERVGGTRTIPIDVRIVAATNKNLREMVQNGEFREDLFYRLNVISLKIPPLRSRIGDIQLMSRYFIEEFIKSNNLQPMDVSKDVFVKLSSWSWPGNIRELRNVIERAILNNTSAILSSEQIELPEDEEINGFPAYELKPGMTVSEAERLLIVKTLEHTQQNRTQAARLLGISIRTLRNKINEYKSGGTLESNI